MVRTRLARFFAAAACVISAFASPAHAQCGGWVHDLESYGPEFIRSFAPRIIDRDGSDGAQIPRIVGVGIDRLVMKSDQDWAFLSERLTGEPYPLEAWDADGPGPMTPRLYFGRGSLASGGDTYLDSVPWPKTGAVGSHALAPVPGRVYDMRLTDPDGPGPARPRPIVVCAGTPENTSIVVLEWDGAAWIRRGPILVGTWAHIIVSPSATGGGDDWILYGHFNRPAPPYVYPVAKFDGNDWVSLSPLGAGLHSGGVSSTTWWDHDGDPASPKRLVVAGSFTESGSTPLNYVAMFDGAHWISLAGGVANPVHAVAAYVHVTTRREELLIITSEAHGYDAKFMAFDGQSWREIGDAGRVDLDGDTLQTWDPDGPLSDPPAALAFLANHYAYPSLGPVLSMWNGEEWKPVARAIRTTSSAQGWWDPDGDGPQRPRLALVSPTGRTPHGTLEISTWDGVEWSIADTGIPATTAYVPGYVSCMTSWDPDSDGPQNPLLVLGGRFTVSVPGAPDIVNVAGWNGESLVPLGEGLKGTSGTSTVEGLISWDTDGDGPQAPRLYAYGPITGSGLDAFKSAAQFDGERWLPLGAGVWPQDASSFDCVKVMAPWDPDLDGPSVGTLLLGGAFSLTEGGPLVALAMWDGEILRAFTDPVPPANLATVTRIAPVRDARSGTDKSALYVGHTWAQSCWQDPTDDYYVCETQVTTRLLIDEAWTLYKSFESTHGWYYGEPFDSGYYPPNVIASHDPDGSGPRREHLIYGHYRADSSSFHVGSYGFPESTEFVGGPVAYDGVGTSYFYDDTWVRAVHSLPVTSDLSIACYAGYFTELVVTNSYYDTANPPRPIDGIARWMEGPPHILEVAEPRTNPETRAFGLTVHAIGGGDLGYQWTRNGEILKGGVTSRGSIIHAPSGPTLLISNASHLDEGEYQCRVINACGSTLGPVLSMPFIHCAADVNFDEAVDILDLLDFLQAYGECEGLPMPCGSTANPDFNGDTMIDVVDFLDFFDRFGQGC
jgi:hypothetical protein